MARKTSHTPLSEVVSPEAVADERRLEASLRPRNFGEYVGQRAVVDKLKVYVAAARKRNRVWQRMRGNPLRRARIWHTATVPVRRIDNLLQKSKSQAEVAQQRCESLGGRQGPEKFETRSRVRMNGGRRSWRRQPRAIEVRRWDVRAECGGRRRPSFRIVTGSSEG